VIFSEDDYGNYAAINWFIVGCFCFFDNNSTVTNSKQNSVFTLLILSSLKLCGDFN
jgi:hypothetical protein